MKSSIIKRKQGSTLLFVLILSAMVAILMTGMAAAILSETNTAKYGVQESQAYFSARSAASAALKELSSCTSAEIDSIVQAGYHDANHIAGTGSNPNLGTYNIMINYVTDAGTIVTPTITNRLRISATATYKGQSSTVTVYVAKAYQNSANPYDNLIYQNGSAGCGLGQCKLTGSITTGGSFNYGTGSTISGVVFANGSSTIDGAGDGLTGLFSIGDVHLDAGGVVTAGNVMATGTAYFSGAGTVYGDVYANGGINISGSGTVTGNAYTCGNLSMTGGGRIGANSSSGNIFASGGINIQGTITGDTYCGGNATINWGSSLQDLTAGGSVSVPAYSSLIHGTSTANASGIPNVPVAPVSIKYNPVVLPTISVPSDLTTAVSPTAANHYTIASSGILSLPSLPYGTIVTIDTSKYNVTCENGLRLVIPSSLALNNGVKFNVTGNKNLYIYLADGANLSIPANAYICRNCTNSSQSDQTQSPQIFIIGTGSGSQSVSVTSSSNLDACLYLPNGSFTATDSVYFSNRNKFNGSAIVKTITIDNNVICSYVSPDLTGTPFEAFGSCGSSVTDTWTVQRWGR